MVFGPIKFTPHTVKISVASVVHKTCIGKEVMVANERREAARRSSFCSKRTGSAHFGGCTVRNIRLLHRLCINGRAVTALRADMYTPASGSAPAAGFCGAVYTGCPL